MKHVPFVPSSAPFSREQRAWLNGFLAGLFADAAAEAGPAETQPGPAAVPLLILFGSQTGSAEGLAKRLAREAERKGFASSVFPLNDYEKAGLATAQRLLVVTSTWGDGDPPDNATACWAWLNAPGTPRLESLLFAVLGLGDRNYSDFCGAAKKFDARLEALGARRLLPRGECDVDYDAAAAAWIESMWPLWPAVTGAVSIPPAHAPAPGALESAAVQPSERAAASGYSRTKPFPARLKTNRRLNQPGSGKETRHLEIVLEGSGLSYEPGDALGVQPQNCPVLVEEVLATLGFSGEEAVADADGTASLLHEALRSSYVITQPSATLLREAATRARHTELLTLLEPANKEQLERWLYGRDVVDVLKACAGASFTPKEFTSQLRKLQPRLYSISSSPRAHLGEVHLTVAAVRYQSHGRSKKGVASCWFADRIVPGETPVPVYIQTSHGFRLPSDLERPVIMIGPGTGIAPFRAFLEERRETGARGRNWLFFGDQCQAHDFLYEEELDALRAGGTLTRLDLAFSRDQAEKLYVQHRMLAAAAEFWAWLEDGAHVYVCGDARRMARDVDVALHQIIAQAGARSPEAAAAYVNQLKTEKRYQRDVY